MGNSSDPLFPVLRYDIQSPTSNETTNISVSVGAIERRLGGGRQANGYQQLRVQIRSWESAMANEEKDGRLSGPPRESSSVPWLGALIHPHVLPCPPQGALLNRRCPSIVLAPSTSTSMGRVTDHHPESPTPCVVSVSVSQPSALYIVRPYAPSCGAARKPPVGFS